MNFEKEVKLTGWLQNPEEDWDAEDYAVSGALCCFAEKSSDGIHKFHKVKRNPYIVGKENKKRKLKWDETKELILQETSGRGHGAVLDQAVFSFSIDNLSRASTLFLCAPEYAEHLQQSLRRATAERFAYIPDDLEGSKELMREQFNFYNKMQESGIPSEDARFILPLFTKTTIDTTWNARELMHLYSMAQRMNIPNEVKDTIEKIYQEASNIAPKLMKDRETNFEVLSWFPSSQLFAEQNSTLERMVSEVKTQKETGVNLIDYCGLNILTEEEICEAIRGRDEALLANLKSIHFTFLAPMSLATFHQATRQRTWNQSVQTLTDAVKSGEYITPPSINSSKFENQYNELNKKSIDFVLSTLDNPDAFGILPHSLQVYDLIHINGWNAIHSIGKRTCKTAQWEIRKIAKEIAGKIKDVYPELGQYSLPQGMLYGKCPERENCGACKK